MSRLLGIEIGGTKLQLGLGDGYGKLDHLVSLSVDPPRGARGIRDQILAAFRSFDVTPSAVGIGFGGPVDAARGVVTTSNQISGWDQFSLVDWVRDQIGVSIVALQNDSDTAALGEARFGAGQGASPILYVNSGSGIGGGLILDGKVYQGSGCGSIEIGHLWIGTTDVLTDAPQILILEKIASGWAVGHAGRLVARHELETQDPDTSSRSSPSSLLSLAGGFPDRVDAKLVAVSAQHAHPQGLQILRRATDAIAQALAHAITLLAPRRIILGGGVSLIQDDLWLDPIRKAVDSYVFPPFRGTFDIQTAALGQDVVVHGALALARDALRSGQENV